MKGKSQVLEIDKCVVSRLWYTTLNTLLSEIHSITEYYTRDQILELISIVQSETSRIDYKDRWIIWKILDLLGVNSLAERPDSIEFILALKFIAERIPNGVEEELLGLFNNVCDSKSVKKPVDEISEQSLKFLDTSLRKYPPVTCRIVKSLLCIWSPFFHQSDAELQNLYINTLKKFLREKDGENTGPAEKIPNRNILEFKKAQTSSEHDSEGTLLSILSELELTEAENDQLLTWLFPALFNNCKSRDVSLAFYARRSNEYFNEWVTFTEKSLSRMEIPDGVENSYGISNAMFDFNENSVGINPTELAYRTIKLTRHWLFDILDISYALLATGTPEKVSTLLSVQILRGLWPIVFFKVLYNLLSPSEAIFGEDEQISTNLSTGLRLVLEKCSPFFIGDEEIWNGIKSAVENQLDIVNWVLENRRFVSDKEFRKDLTIKHVFSLLMNQGILSTLSATTNLHEGNFDEVLKLFKNSSETAATYKAYYAMLCALRAVLLADSYSTKAQDIAKCLTDMKNTLKDLFPLDVRLETIENIFSMLFLRHEDFFNDNNNSEESERETEESEGETEEKKIPETDYKRIQSGFICNKYIIRDLLHYLKAAILDTGIKSASSPRDSIENLDKNFAFISRALADASWRLELLTSSEFVEKVGCGSSNGSENKEAANFSEILLTKKLNGSKISTNKSIFYQQEDSSSSDDHSKSEMDFSSDAGSTENSTSYTGSRKKLWKKNLMEKSAAFNHNYSFILNFMLSSKESLIIQCLWKCDFDKAQQVIEIFNSNDSQLDGEVRFSKAMCQFRRRIRENTEVLNPAIAENKNVEVSSLQVLQNVRQAVREGIQTSRLTGQLETFLASNKATLRLINPDEVNTNEILTMAVLDLALTTGNSRYCSLYACEVATKYLKLCKMIEKSTYSSFFSKICKLFYESKLEAPLPHILCDASIPLSTQKLNDKLEFWNEVEKVIRIFNTARLRRGYSENEVERNSLMQNREMLTSLTSLCSGEAYLAKIFAHLNILQTILPKTLDGNFDGTSFAMLEIPIHSYFGHQFFELGIEPEELEVVAKKLGVNLVHSILVSCCPKFAFHEKTEKIKITNNRGYIILNKDSQDSILTEYDVEKPSECVENILTEILDIIKKICPNKSTLRYTDLENLSKIIEMQDILQKTSCLANVNLCELSDGNETLTFFLNVWNLLFLHSMITVWSVNAPCNRLQHVVSTMKIAYQIGDLGLVTLATLRSKLLGNLAWDLEFFKQSEDINEIAWQDLDLDQDPRVIFAMANEFFGTPALHVYESRDLDEGLNKAIHDYIAYYNLIEPANDETDIDVCWLPEAVCRYQDFLLENASLARQTSGSNLDESFTLRKFLNASEKNLEFKYTILMYQFEVRLNYTGNKFAMNSLETARRSSNNVRKTRNIDENLLQYFEGHCWLLSYLVQRIHKRSPTTSENIERCSCLENLLHSPWTELLRNTLDENQALVGMHENASPREIWAYFESLIKKERWKHCLNVINSLPDNLTIHDNEISSLKDKILSILVSAIASPSDSDEILKLIRQINNIHVLAHAVLSNLKRWPVETCERVLKYILNHSERIELPPNCQLQISSNLSRVTAFHKMLPHFESNAETKHITWYSIASATNKTDSSKIVKSLIDANKFELCLEWLKFHTFSTEIQSLVSKDLLIGLLENDRQDFEPATKLLQALPMNRSIKLCNGVLKKLESLGAIKFVTNYLLDRCKPSEAVKYHKISMSIEILSRLESKERSAFIQLLKHPLLMLEQLLMNGKFEILGRILNAVSENLPKAGISLEDIDKIVRYYAGKSLEFRVALQRDGIESKARDSSSLSSEMENTEFVMPLKVPTKEEWVPNDKARVCSCCKSVVFSMFNRRHHCRRCGRVVCAVCSQQRMRVPTYPDSVHVRVCDDCKRQSIFRMQQQHGAPSTPSSETFDYPRLTTNKILNQTIKDEFSFEHAPSISLCLAILNLHSDHKAYASFLLDRCDEIKQLLRPVSSGRANPEVDHKLLVKMIRSLLVAAKVKCAKLSLNAGLDNCDRMLSHVDLVATLVQSDCSALVPSDNLDEHALRRLRDLLTEKEQWILALDVSTKAGLDRQGVWAAWGKAYLKVGCYNQAREKFAHCLEKVSSNDFENWVFLPSYNQPETPSPKKGENQKAREKTRPAKNPPLLTEILQIIESSTFNRQSSRALNSKSFTAHDISVTLNNIKAISQGRYYDLEPASHADNSYYHESLHYLLSYGSHSAILEFFIKHDKYEECMLHVLDNKVEPDTFFNSVYLPCLKNGCIEKLHEAIRAKDASLITWRNYLVFTCHSLETKKFLNTLYQLQIFTKDYVRASMSCIRFYVNGANNYTDLCSRSEFLHQAQKHLETELQAQSYGPKRRKSTGSQHSGQSSLTLELELSDIDRHINSISRQMEIAKFLRNSEQEGRNVAKFLNDLSNMENEACKAQELPTLFGTQLQKTQLAVLAILCGRDVEEGFGIAFRIIQDYNLRSEKVYSLSGHILASEGKISSVEQLVKCCRSSGAPDTNALSDRVLAHCVKLVLNSAQMEPSSSSKDKVDTLIRLITDLELKISMCIESRQLKAAYLLAVRHSRAQDVRKIFKEADRLEQNAIKAICAKWLQQTQKS